MVTVKLLGAVYLEDANGLRDRAASQRHRLAILALLATARNHIVPREKLMALLWPDRDTEHARKLLNQSIYVLRKALGDDAIVSAGDALRLDTHSINCDVVNFEQAIAAGDLDRSVDIYGGPFLDGFFLNGAAEFDTWAEKERDRLADSYSLTLAELGDRAQLSGDFREALHWWQTLAVHDPLDSGVTLRLMECLEAAGDTAGALQQAEIHERALKAELGIRPPANLVSAVAQLQGLQGSQKPQLPAVPSGSESSSHAAQAGAQALPVAQAESAHGGSPWRFRRHASIAVLALLAVVAAMNWGGDRPKQAGASATGNSSIVSDPATPAHNIRQRRDYVSPDQREPDTNNIAALELYRRGNDPTLSRNNSAARQSLAWFRQAVLLDPEFAAAWAALARASMRVAAAGEFGSDAELYIRAEEAARRALEIDASTAEAYAVLGMLRMYEFDLLSAEPLLQHAIALDPDRASFHEWLVGLYLWMGKPQVALQHAEQAVNLEPFSPSAAAELARALIANGRPDEALAQLALLADVDPPLLRVSIIAAQCHAARSEWQRAIAEIQSGPARAGPHQQALLGYLFARSGNHEAALRIRENLYDKWQHGGGGAVLLAVIEAGLGNVEQAFSWFDRSLEDDSLAATPDQFTLLHPVMRELRGHARFSRLPPFALWIAANAP